MDSGVRATHEELRGRVKILEPATNFVADGWGRAHGTADCVGHGTAIASLAAGATRGIAPAASVLPLRVTDCRGVGDRRTVLEALAWLSEHAAPPAVIVASLDVGDDAEVRGAAEGLVRRGFPVVAASGNAAMDACRTAPGGAKGVLTIGSTDVTDHMATFNNVGSCIDLFAPGEGLVAASSETDVSTRIWSGSSVAAAVVAGVVARYLGAHPHDKPSEVNAALRRAATQRVLLTSSARRVGTPTALLDSREFDWFSGSPKSR